MIRSSPFLPRSANRALGIFGFSRPPSPIYAPWLDSDGILDHRALPAIAPLEPVSLHRGVLSARPRASPSSVAANISKARAMGMQHTPVLRRHPGDPVMKRVLARGAGGHRRSAISSESPGSRPRTNHSSATAAIDGLRAPTTTYGVSCHPEFVSEARGLGPKLNDSRLRACPNA